LQHYTRPEFKLKTAYRVLHKLDDDEIDTIVAFNKSRSLTAEDPWGISKMQATQFLNSDKDVRCAAIIKQ
jgi:hypothetical protein